MKKMIFKVVTLSAVLTSIAGCANMNSISRSAEFPSSNGRVITVDAKQRHFFMSADLDPRSPVNWRVCAEAAPDVFSALASSGALTVDLTSEPSGEAGFAMAETAAMIQRTQSVNLIRESFYRTCERYASGAIDQAQFIVQASRDQRAMVSILAIEQLTGAFRPPATIISGSGTEAGTFSGREAADLVRDTRERRDIAEAARDTAKSMLAEAEEDNGVCGSGDNKDEVGCAEIRLAVDSAEKGLEDAQSSLDNAMEIARHLSRSASSRTSSGTNSTGELTQSVMTGSAAADIAKAVVDIHRAAVINEPLMFCMTVLSGDADRGIFTVDRDSRAKIISTCLEILGNAALADQMFLSRAVSFEAGPAEELIARYASPNLAASEVDRRTAVLMRAMRAANLGQSRADLLLLIANGSEQDRRRLIEEAKKIETNAAGLAELQ